MAKSEKIGTVELLRVNSSGRRLYLNLDAQLCQAFGIQAGDLLRVEIKEKVVSQGPGGER